MPSQELDRESLLIYLNDIRTMETIIFESDKRIEKFEDHLDIYRKYIADDIERKNKASELLKNRPKPNPPTTKHPKRFLVAGLFLTIFSFFCFSRAVNWDFHDNSDFYFATGGVCLFIGPILLIISGLIKNNEKFVNMQYEARLSAYNNAVNHLNSMKEHELSTKKRYESVLHEFEPYVTEINEDKAEIAEKLEKAYSANIIPLIFRNIHGIYYLYDYLSTSNQSLSEALVQYNLEAIKNSLNTVIKLQGEAIVQQAQANAVFYAQNQEILKNCAATARYSQISAVNSELAVRLQTQSLAYQEADYVLRNF